MLTQIYQILHIFLILVFSFSIIVLPPRYFNKWYNRKKYWNKQYNQTKHIAIWLLFLLTTDVIVSLNI